MSDSGGTCVCPTNDLCLADPVYEQCVNEVRNDLITSTAAISALSSFLLGALANLPVGMAPGLGLNAYVRSCHYSPNNNTHDTLVLVLNCRIPWFRSHLIQRGSSRCFPRRVRTLQITELRLTSPYSWIFFALSLLGLRQWLVRIMPQSLILAVGAGIGMFIAYVLPTRRQVLSNVPF